MAELTEEQWAAASLFVPTAADMACDCVLAYMVKHKIPITRRHYCGLAFNNNEPDLDPELESEVPDLLQRYPLRDLDDLWTAIEERGVEGEAAERLFWRVMLEN